VKTCPEGRKWPEYDSDLPMEQEFVLVSACLMGMCCRYNAKVTPPVFEGSSIGRFTAIPVCPEILGGLPTPRSPSEIQNGRVVSNDGLDVTANYLRGAQEALKLARRYKCRYALLKERSPSCGSEKIYDGTFVSRLIPGDGVTARLFKENGIKVFGESEMEALKEL